jgi:hypothetical protein
MTEVFLPAQPSLEDNWRAIILFGRNVASYKFSLAQALLELKAPSGRLIKLDELAGPFSRHICDHLRVADRQGTFGSSKFLDACRKYNRGELTQDQLTEHTVRNGFNNVIDAFHVVGRDALPRRFFVDERQGNNGIRITDEFSGLVAGCQADNLPHEAEARWRLVETAWSLGVSRNIIVVSYDSDSENLFTFDLQNRRKSLTGVHDALNGYQKGKCFYCFSDLQLGGSHRPDVDHFSRTCLSTTSLVQLTEFGTWCWPVGRATEGSKESQIRYRRSGY